MRRPVSLRLAVLTVAVGFLSSVHGAEQLLLETKQIRITAADFEASLERIPEENKVEVLASMARIQKLLENLAVSKTLARRAREAGLGDDPKLRKQVELAEDSMLAQAYVNQQIKALKLPNFEPRARELYKIDIEKYSLPAQVHVSHILVDAKSRTPEQALLRIQEVRAKAVAGKPFAELAQEYSDDPSAKNNKGDLGFFEAGKMVKPFSDAAFAMNKPGEISEPVRTNFGYHIIQFHETQAKKTRPFNEVKQEIIENLREQYIADYRKQMISQIVTDPSTKVYEDVVNRYQTHLDPRNQAQ